MKRALSPKGMVLEIHLHLQPPPPTSFQILRTPFLSFDADHCENVRWRQKKENKKKKSHKSSSAHSHKDSGIASRRLESR